MGETGEITQLLAEIRSGDQETIERLIPIVYEELRRLAGHYMRQERPDHTLQATALVHEAYLRLVGQQSRDWQNRAHFFAVAAQVMRNLLVDHARARQRDKRGGGHLIRLDDAPPLVAAESDDLLAIDGALASLSKIAPRPARIVELRYFGGLSVEEIAVVLGISDRTVRREWQMAKAWLYAEVRGES
jgi:RNA polymerase sigma factor (TIGR02999 family)